MKSHEIYTLEEVKLLIKERDEWRRRYRALERAIKQSTNGSCDTCKHGTGKKGSEAICMECIQAATRSSKRMYHGWQFDEARFMEEA